MIQDQHQFMSHQDVIFDKSGGDKLFAQWIFLTSSYFLMNNGKRQFMNHEGINTNISVRYRLLPQQSVVEPCDFSMTQDWHDNQHQFMSHQYVHIITNSARALFLQENDVEPSDALIFTINIMININL